MWGWRTQTYPYARVGRPRPLLRGLSTERADHLVGAEATSTALACSSQTRSSLVPLRGSLWGPSGRSRAVRSPGTPPPPAPPLLSPYFPVSLPAPLSSLSPFLASPNLRARSRLGSRLRRGRPPAPLPRPGPLFPGGVFPGLPSVPVSASPLAPPPPGPGPPARSLSSPSSPPHLRPEVPGDPPSAQPRSATLSRPGPGLPWWPPPPPAAGGGWGSGGRALLF